ncbi:hypothetical protein [Actinomadura sp. K4S16]|uniref:hypothetical protein n=1 Tax=Actinomadura sp. K4S16 TaxID=1316147 RepID=UPI0011ED271A|nr:hypothetical protein [Actinomadura sp. K4S16]
MRTGEESTRWINGPLPISGPGPNNGDELDPQVAMLAIAVMHITCFIWLIGLGYAPEQALPITIGVGLGTVTVIDRFRKGSGSQ